MFVRLFALSVALVFALPAFATTVLAVDLATQAEDSTAVIEAIVGDNAPFDSATAWYTDTTLDVKRVLGGKAPASITIRQMGGERDGKISRVPGDARLTKGERVVAFVRVIEGQWYLTALAQSVWHVETDGSMARGLDGLAFYALDSTGAAVPADHSLPEPATLAELESAVGELSFGGAR